MSDPPSDPVYGRTALDELFFESLSQYRATPQLVYPFALVGLFALVLDIRVETLEFLYGSELEETLRALLADPAADRLLGVADEVLWFALLGTALLAVLVAVATLLALGIAFLTATDRRRTVERDQVDRFLVVLGRLPTLCVAALLAAVLVGIGLVLLVLPGVYLATRFALAGPAIVADGYGPVGGLRAGWAAATGQFFDVLGVLVLGTVALVVVGLLPLVGEVLAVVGVLPVFALALASLYVEPRHSRAQAEGN